MSPHLRTPGALFFLLPACAEVAPPGVAPPDDVPLEVVVDDAMPTVLHVTWEAVEGFDARIEFGADLGYGLRSTPVEPGRVVLVGSPEDQDVHLRLVLSADGVDHPYPDHAARTGTLGVSLPLPAVAPAPESGGWDGLVVLPVFQSTTNTTHLTMLNGAGEVVWWKPVDWFGPAVYLSRSHGGLLYRVDGYADPDPNGEIVRLDWSGNEVETIASDLGHHDLYEHEDGTIVALEMYSKEVDEVTYVGDTLVEYAPDGTRTVAWDAFETLTPVIPETEGADLNPLGIDWTHANSIDYDPASDRYLVSLYYLQELVAIERATGDVAWELGASTGDLGFASDPESFGPQHAASWVDGGVMIFDNHDNKADPDSTVHASRVSRYVVDPAAGRVGLLETWTPVEDRRTAILGDARLLPDGSWFLSAGALGVAQVVSPDREVVWQVTFPAGSLLGRGAALAEAPSGGS